MFSCGGRADGEGIVTNSQLFPFAGGAGPLAITPSGDKGICFTVTAGNVLDQAACNPDDGKQSFVFGGAGAGIPPTTTTAVETTSSVASPPISDVSTSTTLAVSTPAPESICIITTMVTITRGAAETSAASSDSTVAEVVVTQAPPVNDPAAANPTTRVPVSGAGGFLNPSAVAEAHERNAADIRALSAVSIKSSNGNCLFIDFTAGGPSFFLP